MIGWESLKDRPAPQAGDRIRVHRNLNRRDDVWYSISTPGGQVQGYALSVTLKDVTVRVSGAAQQRIAAGAAREVHAWVTGTLIESLDWREALLLAKVAYRPHERGEFFFDSGGWSNTPYTGGRYASFGPEGMRG